MTGHDEKKELDRSKEESAHFDKTAKEGYLLIPKKEILKHVFGKENDNSEESRKILNSLTKDLEGLEDDGKFIRGPKGKSYINYINDWLK